MFVTWDQLLQVLLLIVEGGTLVCSILALQHKNKK